MSSFPCRLNIHGSSLVVLTLSVHITATETGKSIFLGYSSYILKKILTNKPDRDTSHVFASTENP